MKFGIFTSHSCSDGKEMYKRVWCMCKVVVLLIKPVAFLSFLFPLPLSLLKLPFVYPQFWGWVGVVPYQGILTSTLVHGVGILSIFHLWIFLGGKITTKIKTINDYLFTKWQMAKENLAGLIISFFFWWGHPAGILFGLVYITCLSVQLDWKKLVITIEA